MLCSAHVTRTCRASESQNTNMQMNSLKYFHYRMCNNIEYYYFNERYMTKYLEEFQDLYENESGRISMKEEVRQESAPNSTWWKHLVAGGLAGATSRTCTAPLDRLKVILMVSSNNLKHSSVVKNMLQEGGVRSLWRGNGMNVVKGMPETALKFMFYDQIKKSLKTITGKDDLGVLERMAAGSMAGILSQSAIYPLEVMKTRLILRKSHQSSKSCIKEILKGTNGSFSVIVRAFYRGYIPNILGIVPYAGIDLAIYETLKREYMSHQSTDLEPDTVVLLACGVVSSTCGQLVSYPLNLVRTQLQATPLAQSSSMVGTFRIIFKAHGMAGFFRGYTANLMKVAPSVAIGYVIYEHARVKLGAKMT